MTVFLNFHGLGNPGALDDPGERPYWLPPERFAAILDLVAPAAAHAHITFDDGNESDLALAMPMLRKKGLRAAFFVPTDRIGHPNYLSDTGLKALRAGGMEVGSHGTTHVRWTTLSDSDIQAHVSRSLQRLSVIMGEPVSTVAVPFGAYDRRVLAALRQCKVTRAYTSDGGLIVPGSWIVARNTIRADTPLSHISHLIARAQSLSGTVKAMLRQAKRRMA